MESILVEDFGPQIAVVSGSISSVKNVGEVGSPVSGSDLGNESPLFVKHLLLERVEVDRFVFGNRVQIHIQQCGGGQFGCRESLITQCAGVYFPDQVVRDRISCLVIAGIEAQHFGFGCPVLHNLRGKLYKIPLGMGGAVVFRFAEKLVECMSEFMEQGFCLV